MLNQKKVEIFSRKFHKSLAKQFSEIAVKTLLPILKNKACNEAQYGYTSKSWHVFWTMPIRTSYSMSVSFAGLNVPNANKARSRFLPNESWNGCFQHPCPRNTTIWRICFFFRAVQDCDSAMWQTYNGKTWKHITNIFRQLLKILHFLKVEKGIEGIEIASQSKDERQKCLSNEPATVHNH